MKKNSERSIIKKKLKGRKTKRDFIIKRQLKLHFNDACYEFY